MPPADSLYRDSESNPVMRQSRRMSLVEAATNVLVGYGLAVLTQILVFPMFGLRASLSDNLAIGVVFTIGSIARSYALRRLFEGIRVRDAQTKTAGRRSGRIGRSEVYR